MSHHLSRRQLRARALLLVGVLSLLWNSPEATADFPWSAAHPWSYFVPGAEAPQVVCEGPTYLGRCFVWGGRDLTLDFPLDVLRAPDPQEPATLAWAVNFAAPVAGMAIGAPYGSEEIFVGSVDGHLYAFNASDGATQWIGDTRRESCLLEDGLQAAPAIQEWRLSNAAFQSAQPGDLIFVVTDFGCATTTQNRVIAFETAGNTQII